MCGISFYCSSFSNPSNELDESLKKMTHRGPDGGTFFAQMNQYFVGLGHNRLSIIDLSEAANQPMDLGYWSGYFIQR